MTEPVRKFPGETVLVNFGVIEVKSPNRLCKPEESKANRKVYELYQQGKSQYKKIRNCVDEEEKPKLAILSSYKIAKGLTNINQFRLFRKEAGPINRAVLTNCDGVPKVVSQRSNETLEELKNRAEQVKAKFKCEEVIIENSLLPKIPLNDNPDMFPALGVGYEEMAEFCRYYGGYLITGAQLQFACEKALISCESNISEATRDAHDPDYFDNMAPINPSNPVNDPSVQAVEVRGGSKVGSEGEETLPASRRGSVQPFFRTTEVGWRCAWPLDETGPNVENTPLGPERRH